MSVEEAKEFVKGVNGWLTDREGEFLYQAARSCAGPPTGGVIVEIGSLKGKSTIWLASGSKAGNKIPVYAVDHHQGSPEHYRWYGPAPINTLPEFQKNIKAAEMADIVIPIVKTSAVAAQNFNLPVELIFIDGDHDYQSVKQDFELWFPKLIEGGTIVFHDTGGWAPWIGPIILMFKHIYPSRQLKDMQIVDSMTVAVKTGRVSFLDIIKKFSKIPEWFLNTITMAATLTNLKKLLTKLFVPKSLLRL